MLPRGMILSLVGLLLAGGCAGEPEPLVSGRLATPDRIAVGELLRLDLRWTPAPGFRPPERPWRVFVRIDDERGGTVVNDYHVPEPPVEEWTPGDEVAYTYWLTLPHLSAGTRLRVAAGLDDGVGEIPISTPARPITTRLRRQVELVATTLPGSPEYVEGWHPPTESWKGPERARWTGSRALARLQPPEGGGTLHFRAFASSAWIDGPQQVRLLLDGHELASFEAPKNHEILRHLPIAPRLTGTGPVTLEILVDPIFVPEPAPGAAVTKLPGEANDDGGAASEAPDGYGIQVTLLYLESRQGPPESRHDPAGEAAP